MPRARAPCTTKDTPFLLERISCGPRNVVFAKDSIAVPLNCVVEAGDIVVIFFASYFSPNAVLLFSMPLVIVIYI